MAKRCIICGKVAAYRVKDTPDFYCEECAEENFGDLTMLVNVEEEAQRLKEFLKQRMEDYLEEEEGVPKKKKKQEDDNEQDD
jgi:hypothetical protein